MFNYKHLHYFWVTAKQGGVARASELLHVTPQTISGQLGQLEQHFGEALFAKSGRHLKLTETGKLVLSYADEIFSLGDQLEEAMQTNAQKRRQILRVGVADVVPKSIAYRLLAPALSQPMATRLNCKENSLQNLLAELALHRLDLVIADAPVPSASAIRAFNHSLGECGVSFLAKPPLADQLKDNFPASLQDAPLLIPSDNSSLHHRLQQWLDKLHLHPRVVGEFEDSALLKAFGQAGAGAFAVPSAIAEEIADQYDVEVVGHTEEIREQFFVITAERRVTDPAVVAITREAQEWLGGKRSQLRSSRN